MSLKFNAVAYRYSLSSAVVKPPARYELDNFGAVLDEYEEELDIRPEAPEAPDEPETTETNEEAKNGD